MDQHLESRPNDVCDWRGGRGIHQVMMCGYAYMYAQTYNKGRSTGIWGVVC